MSRATNPNPAVVGLRPVVRKPAASVVGPSAPEAAAAEPGQPPITSRQQRKKRIHTMTLSPDAWARLGEVARRSGLSRSAVVEKLVRETPMPRQLAACTRTDVPIDVKDEHLVRDAWRAK